MYSYDDIITGALIDPDQVWRALDSFWRHRTTVDTRDLVQFQSWASTLLELNIHAKSNHFVRSQTVPDVEAYLKQPWVPLVIFEGRIVDQSLLLYGGTDNYGPTPAQQDFGDQGDPRFLYPLSRPVASIGTMYDAVTNPTTTIDPSMFSFDATTQTITFFINPFTYLTPKVDQTSGENYIVLWLRNAEFDLNVPFDQVGWVLKYFRSGENYAEAIKLMWELVLLGPSLERYEQGLLAAAGLPFATAPEVVRRIEDDGFQHLISTDTQVYKAPLATVNVTVQTGEELTEGQPLTDGIEFLEYEQVLTSTDAQVPGLLLDIPLSTGRVAPLSFANIDTDWEFVASRPSEWRFPVGGAADDVEQFWVDVDTYATANSIDFATLYGLPAAVNPMKRIVQDLMQNSLYVASLNLADMPAELGNFSDRAQLLLPQDVLIVLQQYIGSVADSYDLGTTTSETVGYGYNETAPTEVMTEGAGGSLVQLQYFDLTPGVYVS